jgi:hypothetical protein
VKVRAKNRFTTTLPGEWGKMPSLPARRFLLPSVSIPSQQSGPPADGAAAQHPLVGGAPTGTAAHLERRNHDHPSRPVHFFVVPGGASAGEALVNCPRTTSITGVPNFPGLSW